MHSGRITITPIYPLHASTHPGATFTRPCQTPSTAKYLTSALLLSHGTHGFHPYLPHTYMAKVSVRGTRPDLPLMYTVSSRWNHSAIGLPQWDHGQDTPTPAPSIHGLGQRGRDTHTSTAQHQPERNKEDEGEQVGTRQAYTWPNFYRAPLKQHHSSTRSLMELEEPKIEKVPWNTPFGSPLKLSAEPLLGSFLA